MKTTLEDSTTEKVSQELQDIVECLLTQIASPDTLQRDLFFVLLLVSMLENNFVIIENEVEINNAVEYVDLEQLRKWKSAVGVYECKFILREFQLLPLKLIVSSLGAMVVVNIIIEKLNRETYSVCLPVSKYVVSPHASTVPMIFRDLRHFSITFKNKVLTPVKSRILSHCGFPSASLSGLPEDVLYNILLHLPITDIISTRKTCNTLHCMMDNEDLWHKLCRRDFDNTAGLSDTDSTWLDLYKKEYQLQREASLRRESRHRTAGTLHDYMDHSDFMSYIENPMWDMIM